MKQCKHEHMFSRHCAADVCFHCNDHLSIGGDHIDRCYCGWSRYGDDGYAELLEMGETIEEDSWA